MKNLQGKRFAASYSGGKDSALAVYRAIIAGLLPMGLITTYNINANRSWFHGMTENIVRQVSDSLAIPITLVKTTGEQYRENFEKALINARKEGAEVCVFGDVDIAGHIEWCTERCEKTGLIPYFPLLNEERKKLVYEFVDSGFSAIITVVDTTRMPEEFVGEILTREIADRIEKSGADICGENGEYHTLVFDGPIFKKKVDFKKKEIIKNDKHIILSIE